MSEPLEVDPASQVKPSDDGCPGRHLDYNLRDPEPKPPSQAAPKFLTHSNHKRYKCPEVGQCLAHWKRKSWSRMGDRGEGDKGLSQQPVGPTLGSVTHHTDQEACPGPHPPPIQPPGSQASWTPRSVHFPHTGCTQLASGSRQVTLWPCFLSPWDRNFQIEADMRKS